MTTLLVAAGGTLGVLARYGLSRWAESGSSLIWTTAAINIAGSFLLGLLVTQHGFSSQARSALGVGLLGGFTTYSTFSVQAVLEWDGGRHDVAIAYVLVSVLGGVAAGASGIIVGRQVI